jgi:hypothetical protein
VTRAKLAAAVREQPVNAVELVGLARSADAVLAAGAAGDVTTTRVAETRPPRVARSPGSLLGDGAVVGVALGGGEVGCRVVDRDLWESQESEDL